MRREEILNRLNAPDTPADRLLDDCRSADPALFDRDPGLYLPFCTRLIAQGFPARALELAREGEEALRDNWPLQYRLAQAANRGGNPRYAQSLLAPLLERAAGPDASVPADMSTALRVDAVALQGSILKMRSESEPALARESAEWYQRAAELTGARDLPDGGTFPLINAATMWRIAGDAAKSAALAAETLRRLDALPPERVAGDIWLLATYGEVHILLGQPAEVLVWLQKAVRLAVSENRIGDLGSIRRNYHRLEQIGLKIDPEYLDAHLGSTVVFSGHLVDSPDRRAAGHAPRFPNDEPLVAAVQAAIRAEIEKLNARVGFCSLACGGDILFAEEMLARGAELHVVLPFAEADFLRTSVNFGQEGPAWRGWRRRYDAIIDRLPPPSIHYTTREPFLGSEGLWGHSNSVVQGLAILRGRERVSDPKALLLVDRSQPGQSGGAIEFGETWKRAGLPAEEIDLGDLRKAHAKLGIPPRERVASPLPKAGLARPIKSVLFADVAGFSAIPEWELPAFLDAYARYLRALFAADAGRKITFANTWGDGLYAVFDRAASAADFAVEFLEPKGVEPPDWQAFGLGPTVPIRVGLHAGPVFELPDLFQHRPGYFGQHVNRAARIEPVAVRGCAYASESFAALLTVEAGDRFVIETVGVHSLAKDYDRCRLYRVERK